MPVFVSSPAYLRVDLQVPAYRRKMKAVVICTFLQRLLRTRLSATLLTEIVEEVVIILIIVKIIFIFITCR
jgi:hypothetical protein